MDSETVYNMALDAGSKKDYQFYYLYLEQAAIMGQPTACFLIGRAYLRGTEYTAFDPKRAFQYLNKAASLKNLEAYGLAGWCLYKGIGTNMDPALAFRYWNTSAGRQEKTGYGFWGISVWEGRGAKYNLQEALQIWNVGQKKGDKLSGALLLIQYVSTTGPVNGMLGTNITWESAWNQLLKGSWYEAPIAYSFIARTYREGLGKVIAKDPKKAFDNATLGASLGDGDSYCELGMCYLTGTGCQQDPSLALQNFKNAIDRGSVRAYMAMSDVYKEGKCGMIKNKVAAIAYLKQALTLAGKMDKDFIDLKLSVL